MLEFRHILPQFGELAKSISEQMDVKRDQLKTAVGIASEDEEAWADHLQKIKTTKTKWLVGIPLGDATLRGAVKPSPVGVPIPYSALATDGSQIPLDRHEAAPCYVLNVGRIALHYGTGERPLMDSQPQLFFRDEDLLVESGDGVSTELSYVTERDIATRRFLAEMEALGDLIEKFSDRPDCVALVDGTLILWAQEARSEGAKDKTVQAFLAVMEKARSSRIPVIGYLSRPASREVIGALRVVLGEADAGEAKGPSINRLSDADLFRSLLAAGQRSGLFASQSKILKDYDPDGQKITFCYLNAGGEIARLEMPRWVADDTELLDRCHVVCVDQIAKGHGYPVCLSEAHEMAIIRAPERAAFYQLIERVLIEARLPVLRTAKAAAKRRRAV